MSWWTEVKSPEELSQRIKSEQARISVSKFARLRRLDAGVPKNIIKADRRSRVIDQHHVGKWGLPQHYSFMGHQEE